MDFENLTYTVKTSAKGKAAGPLDKLKGTTLDKDLLQDISGSVAPGSVLAILGPSGAGKTTLLNMLTLEKKGGVPQGHIRIGSTPFTLDKYNRTAASVEQFDTLWASLTVRDHLVNAVRLYQPNLDAAARDTAIQDLIKSVGLEDQQHIKAGNEFMRGLSSGNKRRLSIAVALTKRPSVLFLDEPTSGVDSASAVMIMSFLKDIAEARSIIIVCTIHQPPASVFAGFDNCMVLSMGRVAYFGKAGSMGEYFASIGNPPPPDTNIAEFVLDLCAPRPSPPRPAPRPSLPRPCPLPWAAVRPPAPSWLLKWLQPTVAAPYSAARMPPLCHHSMRRSRLPLLPHPPPAPQGQHRLHPSPSLHPSPNPDSSPPTPPSPNLNPDPEPLP